MSITIDRVRQRAEADAKMHGYYLTPDPKFLQDLLEGLKTNEERYGYPSCPCRPATGVYEQDRDIICPCDYRDPDVAEFGACYCSLYVNKAVYDSGKPIPIPERRPPEKMFPDLAPKPTEETKLNQPQLPRQQGTSSGTANSAATSSTARNHPTSAPSAGRRRSSSHRLF